VLSFALALALLQDPVAPTPASSTLGIPRIEDARVTIDGVLDEPVWSRAARLTGFRQYEPVDGRAAEEETEVLVWYSPDAIHFGIIARDRQPSTIRATVADRDNIDGDDHVTIFLDTFADRRRAFFFAVNPLGVQQDGVRAEGAASAGRTFGGSTDKSPDYFYESKGRLTDEGYVVEVRIPFKSLRYPAGGPQRWGLQIERKVQRTGYVDTWTDVRRANASFLAQAGTLEGLHGMKRGVVLEAQPFLTASANGARELPAGDFRREALSPDAGVNLRLGFTSVSLDATINPDFSQVEADAGQVTINERFALFFPEKRPFFLEGIELFATPNQLVHTRRIVDPRVGGKLTGKVGGISIAHLTALDEFSAGGDALVNITRLRRDFAANSHAGVTYTDRAPGGSEAYNRVIAADVRHVFGGLYYAEAQLGGSWSGASASTPTVHGAPIWKMELDRTGRRWGFNWRISGIDDDFRADLGYVRRRGVVDASAFNRLSFYGAPGARVERVNFQLAPSRLWRYEDFGREGAIEGGESLSMEMRMRGGWSLTARPARNFYRLDREDYAAYEVMGPSGWSPYVPLDELGGYGASLELGTPRFQRMNASFSAEYRQAPIFDEGADGRLSAASVDFALRPTASVRAALGSRYQRITRELDGSEFAHTILPRARLEYQPMRALFFRSIAEWRSERRAALVGARDGQPLRLRGEPALARKIESLRLDLLASYTPVPGTVVFLGYGATLGAEDVLAFRGVQRDADGLFVKLAYQFRR
jgi:hypothetical protein